MRPNETFVYLKNNQVCYDGASLTQLYLPIMGKDALALYDYFYHFFDHGSQKHYFSDILNQLQFGMAPMEEALAILTGLDLVGFYKTTEHYLILLKPALGKEAFLAQPIYRKLLENRIGQPAVERLECRLPQTYKDLSKRFSDVFGDTGEVELKPVQSQTQFDLMAFKDRMKADGLAFADEAHDVIALHNIAERYNLSWYQTYLLAKETAVNLTISPKRMQIKQETAEQEAQSMSDLTKEEAIILREAKACKAEIFLAKIKNSRQAVVTADEQNLLRDLAQRGFLDEVINVMVLYTLNKTHSANVNKTYLMKIANDFAFKKIVTAEEAICQMREFTERKPATANKPTKPQKTNIPAWSNQDYKNETTEDDLARLEELKRRSLEKLRKKDE
ncbi:helicase loader [Streptococcus caprae]|uniref:Helicase loader n=1 Tax=Streptococcus caprae TaxID=1640501 RepID=A0ABV8CWW5_9STRE